MRRILYALLFLHIALLFFMVTHSRCEDRLAGGGATMMMVGGTAAAGGGGGGTVTYIGGNLGDGGPSASSIGVTYTATAGNLVVAWAGWDGTPGTVSLSDGTSSFTGGTQAHNSDGADTYGQFFYLLSSNGGSKTYTVSFGATVDWSTLTVIEFHVTSGTWAFDAQNTGTGNSTACASGVITTASTSEAVIGGYRSGSVSTTSSEQINGVAATEDAAVSPNSLDSVWYRIPVATFAGGTASATVTSQRWICNVIAFKAQ
ncbi:MAG: hypothetical protein WA058_02090 [Minisyncoccia bacterium]